MTSLIHPANGHRISTNDKSVEFWVAAGYRLEITKAPAKKAVAKKSSSTKK